MSAVCLGSGVCAGVRFSFLPGTVAKCVQKSEWGFRVYVYMTLVDAHSLL